MPSLSQNIVRTTASWQDRVKDKQEHILADVPTQFLHSDLQFSDNEAKYVLELPVFSESNPARVMDFPEKYLSKDELAITALKAEDIPPTILAGTWTAVEVLDAFTHRAVIAHQLLHCCLSFVIHRHENRQKHSMLNLQRLANLVVRCMACLSQSRTSAALRVRRRLVAMSHIWASGMMKIVYS